MHTKNSGRFAVDKDFLQFRTAPKMMMDRKWNWAENETDLKTKIPKTKLVRNWQICSFGTENEIRSVSTCNSTLIPTTNLINLHCILIYWKFRFLIIVTVIRMMIMPQQWDCYCNDNKMWHKWHCWFPICDCNELML